MKNWSIAKRIQLSLMTAIGMVLLVGFLSFFYINRLNTGLQEITNGLDSTAVGLQQLTDGLEKVIQRDIRLTRLTEQIQSSTYELAKKESQFLINPRNNIHRQELEEIAGNTLGMAEQARKLSQKEENIERYGKIIQYIRDYISLISQMDGPNALQAQISQQQMMAKRQNLKELNSEVLQDRYKELQAHQLELNKLGREARLKSLEARDRSKTAEAKISDAQRNMIIVVLLMLFSGLGLGFVSPSVVTAPFKKMVQAINEVRTGKLNISIPVEADDEIGEIAKSLNNMITELREFDEMKIKRIAFEKRRFVTLANMVDYGVLVLKREGIIEFINTQLYLLLKCDTKEIEGYRIEHTPLPQEIKDFLVECLNTKEKMDNRELSINLKRKKGDKFSVDLLVDTAMVRTHTGTIVNIIVTFEEKDTHVDRAFLARSLAIKEEEQSE
jgi:nitrogen fixation/metabolism regulation signal transduction histidine kinase